MYRIGFLRKASNVLKMDLSPNASSSSPCFSKGSIVTGVSPDLSLTVATCIAHFKPDESSGRCESVKITRIVIWAQAVILFYEASISHARVSLAGFMVQPCRLRQQQASRIVPSKNYLAFKRELVEQHSSISCRAQTSGIQLRERIVL